MARQPSTTQRRLGEQREYVDQRDTGSRMTRLDPAQEVDRESVSLCLLSSIEGRGHWTEDRRRLAARAPALEMAELNVAQLVRQDSAQHIE